MKTFIKIVTKTRKRDLKNVLYFVYVEICGLFFTKFIIFVENAKAYYFCRKRENIFVKKLNILNHVSVLAFINMEIISSTLFYKHVLC